MVTAAFSCSTPGSPGYWDVVLDVIPFPVYVVDVETFRIIRTNRAMRQKTEAKDGDVCHVAIHGLDQPCPFCRIAELDEMALHDSGSLVFEQFNERDDCWYQLRETMMTWIDGRRAKYSVAVDISALKETQNALAEAHAELSITNRSLSATLDREQQTVRGQRNFLAMVSHEFRTPLAVIDGARQLLDLYTRGHGEAGEELAKIRRATYRMTELIDICLADDRLESSAPVLQKTDVDLAGLLQDLLAEKRSLDGGGRLVLQVTGHPVVVADQALLQVALSNLIDNALKYSPVSEPIEVSAATQGAEVSITVTDRGTGIAEAERGRIFEKFFRTAAAEGVRGAGLGLFIVKRIVDLHQGQVSVSCRPEGGSVFKICLSNTPRPNSVSRDVR